jgi:hypothetical protein
MQLKNVCWVFSESMCITTLLFAQVPCDVLRSGKAHLFQFFGRLPQGIVSEFCWCKTLQECSDAVILIVTGDFFEFLLCCAK